MRAAWNRQRHLVAFTLSSLARRRGKALALLAVYAAVVFMLASALLFAEALRREARALLAGAPEILVQRLLAGRHDPVPAGRLDAIRGIRGVAGVEGRLWGYQFDATAAANFTVLVPNRDAPPPGTADIGAGVARVRGAAPGDRIQLRAADGTPRSFRVRRVLDSGTELVTADLFLIGTGDFHGLFGFPEAAFTDLAVSVRNPREVATVTEKIAALFPDARIVTRAQILRTYEAVFDWREGMVLVLLAGSILALAILAWEKASGLSAEEQREIGVLKAVGWDTGDILRMKMWEGALVSLGASMAGYLAAWVHVFVFGAPLFAAALKGWAVLYPQAPLAAEVDGVQVATLFFLTVFPYLAATLVPVWRAASVDPDAAMR